MQRFLKVALQGLIQSVSFALTTQLKNPPGTSPRQIYEVFETVCSKEYVWIFNGRLRLLTLLPLALFVDLLGIKKKTQKAGDLVCLIIQGWVKGVQGRWHNQKAFQGSHLSAPTATLPSPFSSHLLLVATQPRVGDVFPRCLRGCCTLSWVMMMMHSAHVPFEKFGSVSSVDFPPELLRPTQIGSAVPRCQDLWGDLGDTGAPKLKALGAQLYFGLLSRLPSCINQDEITQIIHNIYVTFHNTRGFFPARLECSTPASSRLWFTLGPNFKPSVGLRKGSAGPSPGAVNCV